MKKTLTILASALLIGTSVAAVRNSLSESTAIGKKDVGIEQRHASATPTHQVSAKAPVMNNSKFIKTITYDFTEIPAEGNTYEDSYWVWDEANQTDVYSTYRYINTYLYDQEYNQEIYLYNPKWSEDGLIVDNWRNHMEISARFNNYAALNATFYCEYLNGIDAEHPLRLNSDDFKITYADNSFTVDFPYRGYDDIYVYLTDLEKQSMKITHVDYQISLLHSDYTNVTEDGSAIGFCLRTVESEWLNIPRDEYACVYAIGSENDCVTIPETVNANGRDYRVISLGYTSFGTIREDYIDIWSYSLEVIDPSDITKIIIPESVEFVYYSNLSHSTEIYLPGHAKAYIYANGYRTMHVDNRQAFVDYANRNSTLPRYFVGDYPKDWAVINVEKPGTWAQQYIEQAGEDWSTFGYIKVNGEINETDLSHMQHLKYLEGLDLTGTPITTLPAYFLPESQYTLSEIILPETVKTLENYALYQRYNLSKINLENVENIGYGAFYNTKLSEIDLSSAKNINYNAFRYCPLTSIIWPSNTENLQLDNYAFAYTSIPSLNIPDGLTVIPGYCFIGCTSLEEVTLPKSLQKICYQAFNGCSLISEIVIPEGTLKIEDQVFGNCESLKSVTLPSTLTNIGNSAFGNCPELVSLKCAAVMPPEAGRDLATDINTFKATLYVLPFVKDLYHNATGWNNFMLVDDLMEQVDKLYVNRPLEIVIDSEYNDLLSNNPIVEIRSNGKRNDQNVGELTISGNGTFSAGNFIIDSYLRQRENFSNNIDWSATMVNVADNMRADAVTTNLHLYSWNGYSYWHFISFPYDVRISDIIPGENLHWVIRAYDAAARANGDFDNTWTDLDKDYVLMAGKGYIIAATNPNNYYGNYTEKNFTVPAVNNQNKNKIFATGDVTVALEEIPSELVQNRSWNFIGNPYPAYYQLNTLKNFTAPVTLWRGSSYAAFSPVDDDIILRPNEAFFVQCPTDQTTMTFAGEGRLHASEAFALNESLDNGLRAPQYIPMEGRNVFNFNVQGANATDRTRVVINPEAEMEYQMSCDAPKFFAETATDIEIYTTDGETQYSINERPLAQGNVTMGIKAKQGEYKINVNGKFNSEYTVLLTDVISGNVVDLTSEDYTFIVNEDFQGDRFVISFCTEVTGIDQITSLISSDENVTITAINGVTLYKGQLSGFRAPNAGIYIINAAANSYKAFLK